MTDWTALTAAIATAEATGALLGVATIAPNGTSFAHNATRRFTAASTVKIPIMVELFRRIDQGRDSLDHIHVLRAEDQATGGGVVKELHPGITFTVADLCYLMMAISDNSTTNILIDRVGMAETNATMQSLGMTNSVLGRPMRGRPPLDGESENWAVPGEYAGLIAALFANTAASPAACAAMIGQLEKQTNDRRIARHLPRTNRPRWGSKTGSLPGVTNDVGFIMTPHGPLILSIYVEIADPIAGEAIADPIAGEAIIGDIARAALAAVT